MPALLRCLMPGGLAVLEIGIGQADAVASLAQAAGLELSGVRPDLGGVDRALLLTSPVEPSTLASGGQKTFGSRRIRS
jgi:release factor glutamine methyltransferase